MDVGTMSHQPKRAGSLPGMQMRAPGRSPGSSALSTLERRISELEQIASTQSRELKIQFQRIAQLQAECDILRIRFIKP